MKLPINELFETVQGEGHWTGTPAVFIRVQGCPVGCPWCDTKHTWVVDPAQRVSVAAMMAKTDTPSEAYAECAVGEVVDLVSAFESRHVVITGGEPCMHDLSELAAELARSGRRVQVETSGTHAVRASGAWVTLSPKLGMPGGFGVLRDAIGRADEIKHPIGRPLDFERLRAEILPHAKPGVPVYLQPLSLSPTATAYARSYAAQHGYRVSLQIHRLAGIR